MTKKLPPRPTRGLAYEPEVAGAAWLAAADESRHETEWRSTDVVAREATWLDTLTIAAGQHELVLRKSAAGSVIQVLRRRKLGIGQLRELSELLYSMDERFDCAVERLESVWQFLGCDAESFLRLRLLIIANERLDSPKILAQALHLARKAAASSLDQRCLHPDFIAVPRGRRVNARDDGAGNRERAELDLGLDLELEFLRFDIAYFDAISRLNDGFADNVMQALERVFTSPRGVDYSRAREALKTYVRSIIAACTEASLPASQPSDLLPSRRLEALSDRLSIKSTLDGYFRIELDFLWKLISSSFSYEVDSLCLVSTHIASEPDSEKRRILNDLLQGSLQEAFDVSGYPEDRRTEFADRVIDALLGRDAFKERSSLAKTRESAEGFEQSQGLRIPLPDSAPAIWKDDKKKKDTPIDFIKRHYGRWLRADATGLTRPDIRRLDYSLYMGLSNWLRNNELPDDCPLPMKSDVVAREEQEFDALGIDESSFARTAWRRRDRARGPRDR